MYQLDPSDLLSLTATMNYIAYLNRCLYTQHAWV
jgi:hypothetical protein